MPINIQNETPISLADAARAVPPIDGKRPHVSTLWRWCRRGLRGVHLEYVRFGHRVCTSEQALARFAHRLAEADGNPETSPPKSRTQSKSPARRERQRAVHRAEAELAEANI